MVGVVLPLALLGGCQSGGRTSTHAAAVDNRPTGDVSLALPGEVIAAYEASPEGTIPYERYEYARRDRLLSPTSDAPLLATLQWPARIPPSERRVRFHYWRQ